MKMTFDRDQIKIRFPLHFYVWNNDIDGLKKYLKSPSKPNLEQKDPRGRTALMLAVTLEHKKCAQILLNHSASVNVTDESGFNVLHEAVTSADPEFIRDVYEQKEVQRYSSRVDGIPNLLSKICDTTDFYLEMKWEFTSWLPLVSRLCPNDTYKVYKSGSKVRVDTTLIGVDMNNGGIAGTPNWQRGRKSFIFTGSEDGAIYMEVDHEEKVIQKRTMKVITQEEILEFLQPTEDQISERLSNPISTTFIDTEKIAFERSKSGIIGFRSDRVEMINGYECKVYSANNVELVTKTRTEHLTNDDKERLRAMENSRLNSLRSWAGIVETHLPNPFENMNLEGPDKRNPWKLTIVDYFNTTINDTEPTVENGGSPKHNSAIQNNVIKDVGIPREMSIKTQQFKANLWLSEEFPLSLPEQMLPIVDLMALSSSHFAKLREFIAAKLPSGFPVKIEIPLFHLLNARITFGNIFATNEAVEGVTPILLDSECQPSKWSCKVDESCFEAPSDYQVIGSDSDDLHDVNAFDDEDYSDAWEHYFIGGGGGAISRNGSKVNNHGYGVSDGRSTLADTDMKTSNEIEREQMTLLEALKTNNQPNEMIDSDLQRAIQLSLLEYQREQKQTKQTGDIVDDQQQHSSSDLLHKATAVAHSILNTIQQESVKHSTMTNGSSSILDDGSTTMVVDVEEDGFALIKNNQSKNDQLSSSSIVMKHRPPVNSPSDEALQMTIEASRIQAEEEAKLQQEEEEMLKKVIKLSILDK